MGKIRSVFVLRTFIFAAALALGLSSINNATAANDDAAELEELLDDAGEETEVETEEEYALPVPQSAEEDSPTLSEADQGALSPGDRSSEDLFLPVPSDQVGLPAVEGEATEDFMPFYKAGDVRHESKDSGFRKPGWTLFGGYSMKTYTTDIIKEAKNGLILGTHFRIFGWDFFRMPLSLHVLASVNFVSLDDVKIIVLEAGVERELAAQSVKERTYRVGGLLEWEFSRRIQAYGGLYKQVSEVEAKGASIVDPNQATGFRGISASSVTDTLREDIINFGVGLNWDFYVIPHASFGLRAWMEPRYFAMMLTFTAEPVPRNRNSLNFEWDD